MHGTFREAPHLIVVAAAAALAAAPVRAQDQQEVSWQSGVTDWRGRTGQAFNVYCPPAGTDRGGSVWGVGVYTDDSAVCVAAVHTLATFDFARGGTVYFEMEPGQEGYEADRRRGVQTATWGVWQGGFRIIAGVPGKRLNEIADDTPLEIAWTTSARFLRGRNDEDRAVYCPRSGLAQPVWGAGPYGDDSSICTAAVHAGLITFADGGGITLRIEPGREKYGASTRNGVSTMAWEKWEGSFSFPRRQVVRAVPPPGPDAPRSEVAQGSQVLSMSMQAPTRGPSGEFILTWRTVAAQLPDEPLRILTAYCPAGGSELTIWGSGTYTDDSSICTAAVHALATFDFARGGTVYVTAAAGQEAYAAEERRGLTSSEYGAWERSFRIVAGVPGTHPAEVSDSTPVEIDWGTTAQHLRGARGDRRMVCPPKAQTRPVWGSVVYSDHSSICGAALHAGLVSRETGGAVTVRLLDGQSNYAGTTQNGVVTGPLASWAASFTFVREEP